MSKENDSDFGANQDEVFDTDGYDLSDFVNDNVNNQISNRSHSAENSNNTADLESFSRDSVFSQRNSYKKTHDDQSLDLDETMPEVQKQIRRHRRSEVSNSDGDVSAEETTSANTDRNAKIARRQQLEDVKSGQYAIVKKRRDSRASRRKPDTGQIQQQSRRVSAQKAKRLKKDDLPQEVSENLKKKKIVRQRREATKGRSVPKLDRENIVKSLGSFVFSLILIGGVVAIVVSGALFFKPFAHNVDVSPALIAVKETVNVCPSDPLIPKSNSGNNSEFTPVSNSASGIIQAVAVNPPGARGTNTQTQDLKRKKIGNFKQGNNGSSSSLQVQNNQKVDTTTKLTAPAVDNKQVELSSNYTYNSDSDDIRGLASTTCQNPSSEMWINGASTSLGNNSVLTLVNPSDGNANVAMTLYDDQGEISSIPLNEISVGPNSQKSLLMASLAPNKERLTIKITSSGSSIAATISQSKTRGLTSGGVEILSPSPAPSTQQIITGYRSIGKNETKKIVSQDGYEDAKPVLRLTASDEEADVRITVYDKKGRVDFDDSSTIVKANSVKDVPLDSLAAGEYSISVSSENNILAAAKMISGKAGDETDFTWANAGDEFDSQNISVIGYKVKTRLSLFSPKGDADATITPIYSDASWGSERKEKLTSGQTKVVDVSSSEGKTIIGFAVNTSGNPVFGSEMMTGDSGFQLSWKPVLKPSQKQSGIPVAMHY